LWFTAEANVPVTSAVGKKLVKTLAMRPLREYNMNEELIRRKPVLFQNLQHPRNATAMPGDGTQARLRAW
jgi:hypothetical protein